MAIRTARTNSGPLFTFLRVLQFVRQLRRRLNSHPRTPSWPVPLGPETCLALQAKTLGRLSKSLPRNAVVGLRNRKHLLNASDRISKGRDRKNVRPTLKLQTPGQNRGAIQNRAGGEVQQMLRDVDKNLSPSGVALSAIASDNRHFLAQKPSLNLEACTLNEVIPLLFMVHDAINVLEACRTQFGDGWVIEQGQGAGFNFDELFFANYEHLLRRLLTELVDELSRKVLETLLLGGHDKKQHRMLSWFAEFSDKPRPLSTFPWTIKPSLAVLWGVCWMFYNAGDQSQNAAERSNQRVSQTAVLQNVELPEWGQPGGEEYFSFGLELLGTQTQPAAPQLANDAVDLRLRNAEPWAPGGVGPGSDLSGHGRALSRVSPGPVRRPAPACPVLSTTYSPPFPAGLPAETSPDLIRDYLPAPHGHNATLPVYAQFTHVANYDDSPWHPLQQTPLPQRPARHLTNANVPVLRVTPVLGSTELAAPQNEFVASDYSLYQPSAPEPQAPALHFFTDYMDPSYNHSTPTAAAMGNCQPADVSPTVALPGPRHERTPSLNSTNIPTPVSLACPRSPLPSPAEDRRPSISSAMGHRRHRSEDTSSQSGDDMSEARKNHAFKRAEEPPRNAEGKMVCKYQECANLTFERKCEWSKHMDKHDRPYKCAVKGCEKLQGFTYSGGLLRHEREVHKMHGGTKKSLFCPFADCKRSSGAGFTRKENLAEHIRRVHRRTSMSVDMGHLIIPRRVSMDDSSPADVRLPSESPFQRIIEERAEDETKFSLKRKPSDAALSADGDDDLRVEVKRLRRENEEKDSRLRQLEAAVMALQQRR